MCVFILNLSIKISRLYEEALQQFLYLIKLLPKRLTSRFTINIHTLIVIDVKTLASRRRGRKAMRVQMETHGSERVISGWDMQLEDHPRKLVFGRGKPSRF
jgi:hypothetical protein